jgi:hypothetical protein
MDEDIKGRIAARRAVPSDTAEMEKRVSKEDTTVVLCIIVSICSREEMVASVVCLSYRISPAWSLMRWLQPFEYRLL